LITYGVLSLVNLIVMGLSGHINQFQEFYYKADVVAFGLSLATGIWILLMIILDVASSNASTAKPAFELTWLCLVTLLWLGFGAFSTNRWRGVGAGLCKTIPTASQYDGYRTWCHEVQALRAFIWIEWVIFLFTFAYLLRWTLEKSNSGRNDVWATSFSRFQEMQTGSITRATSEFLQWEKFEGNAQAPSRLENPVQSFEHQAPSMSNNGYARDSSVPPMTTAYARAQYQQGQQAYPAYNGQQMQYTEQSSYPQYVSQNGAQFNMSQSAQYGDASHAI